MNAKLKYEKFLKQNCILNNSLLPQMIRLYGDSNKTYGKTLSILKKSLLSQYRNPNSVMGLDDEREFHLYNKNNHKFVRGFSRFSKSTTKIIKPFTKIKN